MGQEYYLPAFKIWRFEIAMLSLMDEEMSFTPDEKEKVLRHSQLLRLDIDNVYDDNFWEKLNNYLRA